MYSFNIIALEMIISQNTVTKPLMSFQDLKSLMLASAQRGTHLLPKSTNYCLINPLTRLMILRTKKDALLKASDDGFNTLKARPAQRIPLPHNSMFILGLATNRKWLHGIRQDKRLIVEKSPAEMAYEGGRISLTFRQIGTFLKVSENGMHIWGQGAKGRTYHDMRPVLVGDEAETAKMIYAFGQENQQSDFDWNAVYGDGFDVLHFTVRATEADMLDM
jgi:hypothetical protein